MVTPTPILLESVHAYPRWRGSVDGTPHCYFAPWCIRRVAPIGDDRPRFDRVDQVTREGNLALPAVQNLLKASKAAKKGLWTIAWGTGLQLGPIIAKPLIWAIGLGLGA